MRPIMSISLLKAANVWRFTNPEFLSTAFAAKGLGLSILPASSLQNRADVNCDNFASLP
jgi:hypothetical protein